MSAGLPVERRLGPYLLRGLLGSGAMGEVHRATDTAHDGRTVALKLLPPQVARDPRRRARFEHEARIVAALGEPHVIDVHSYGEIDGRLFLDMQLVDGPDLAAYLIATGPLHPEHAVAVVEQVAAALDAAHAAGLVHHDVKPSNVLLYRPVPGRAPHAVLSDFGIAGDAGGFGTVEYLAPERINGRPGDRRVDVYALACVLHELLTGTRAFPGAEFAAQVHGHLRLPPPRPSTIVAGLPAALDEVVAAGMAKDLAARVAGAGQLATMARAALAMPRRGPSRRRLLVGAAAGVVTLGGGLAVAAGLRGSGVVGGGIVGGGATPVRVVADRVLGVRSSDFRPFRLGSAGGLALAVVLGKDTVQAWDVVADRAVGPAHPGGPISGGIAVLSSGLAVADVDGRAVLCSTRGLPASLGETSPVVVADLGTGKSLAAVQVTEPRTLATAVLDGAPVVMVLDNDGSLTRIDLRTLTTTGPPVRLPRATILSSVEVTELGGTARVVITSLTGPTTVYDVASLQEVADFPTLVNVVAELDGDPVALGAADGLRVARPGEQRPRTIEAPGSGQVTATDVGGRLVAAVGFRTGDIALYDVGAGTRIGSPLTGHHAEITQLGIVALDDRPLLVSAAADNAIRVWDLAVHAHG